VSHVIDVPALCGNCGGVFSSGIVADGSTNITIAGFRATCPYCGGVGAIPEGSYDFIGETIHVLAATPYSREQLERIRTILSELKDKEASTSEDVAAALEGEAPELARIIRERLVPRTAADLYTLLTLLLGIVTIILKRG
jgi:hypothetical protein